ncbi:MAG: hypothetical protein MUP90_15905 [Gammaproteobacteria bacterium]|nr:hypothetical protein [Gammaproteobacteria bacterium]
MSNLRINLFFALLLAATGATAEGQREVVLVVAANSPIIAVSSLELRKLYLGIPVSLDGVLVRPLRNHSDEQLQEIFFQSAMAMSEAAYERQLLSLTLRFGRLQPEVRHSAKELIAILRQDNNAITYMWRSDISVEDGLRVVKLLWLEH